MCVSLCVHTRTFGVRVPSCKIIRLCLTNNHTSIPHFQLKFPHANAILSHFGEALLGFVHKKFRPIHLSKPKQEPNELYEEPLNRKQSKFAFKSKAFKVNKFVIGIMVM